MHMISTLRLAASTAALLVLAGCASTNHKAPVEERSRPVGSPSASTPSSTAPARVLPGAENAGKPGYYTVKPGDTLIRISLDSGQNWRDLAAWNSLENPNLIEVGQVLRVVPPTSEPGSASGVAATRPLTPPSRIEARPLDSKTPPATGKPASGAATPTAGSALAAAASGAQAASSADAGKDKPRESGGDEPNWIWPASGPTLGGFEEGRRKGLSIGGKAGDPVVAAADGRVVYAGSGLRGYGNLVIIKHTGDYLTAYAHNQTLLVKEDQTVRRGQKIAEMGATDSDRVNLHFEIRKQGKPIDPARQLPAR